jgi:U-box domain
MPLPPFERTDPNAELRRVWKGKHPLPAGAMQLEFTPAAPKIGGGFPGAIYEKTPTKPGKSRKEAKRWNGKPGFSFRGFEVSSEMERTRSITRRGLDAIAEKVAGDAYHAANMSGRYFVPKHRLAILPVRHAFLQKDHMSLVDIALGDINKGRAVPITEAIHVFSKWIDGFQDLASIKTRLKGVVMPFMDAITLHHCVPETVFVDGVDVPLIGLMEILAVSRLLADSDVLGGKGDNAGIILYCDAQGHPVVARAVKIDPGFAFNFRGHENRFQRTRAAQFVALGEGEAFVPEGDMLKDLKDIQFGNNHLVNIEWQTLSDTQRQDFFLSFQHAELAFGEGTMVEMLLLRGGAFKVKGEDLVREATAMALAKKWRDNIKQQRKCYEAEYKRCEAALGARGLVQEKEWTSFAGRLKGEAASGAAAARADVRGDLRAAERSAEIPEEFICSITLEGELMIDPVMSPVSGRSFERTAIETWVRQSGTDPLTRAPLRLDQLIPNRDLKAAIERFKAEQSSQAARPLSASPAKKEPAVTPAISVVAPAAAARLPQAAARAELPAAVAQPAAARAAPAAGAVAAAGLFAAARPAAAAVVARRVDQAAVDQLILHVAQGKQDEAEALIRANPDLLMHKGTVTDYAGRTFRGITALQYAFWGLDWHMWKMIRKYLSPEEFARQFRELEAQPAEHGAHYDGAPLIAALQRYVDRYGAWVASSNWAAMIEQWTRVVGGEQRRMSISLANEYCHPTRSFHPCPTFTEEALPRCLKLYGDSSLFPLVAGSGVGFNFGVYRGAFGPRPGTALPVRACPAGGCSAPGIAQSDLSAVTGFCKVRTAQLAELRREFDLAPARRPGAS